MRSGLSTSESNYFLLADIERQFNKDDDIMVQFNDVIFENVRFECGVEMTLRKQAGRIDTLNPLITSPKLNLATSNHNSEHPLLDRLIFTAGDQTYDLICQGSLADNINQRIRNGQD